MTRSIQHTHDAHHHVISCHISHPSAGAIGSPHLLMLSGIGPREQLIKQGIPCIADLPVGQSLQGNTS